MVPRLLHDRIREHRHLVDLVIWRTLKGHWICRDDRDDMHQDGLIGLWRAIEEHDGREAGFQSFAMAHIQGRVVDGLRRRGRQAWHGRYEEELAELDADLERVGAVEQVHAAFDSLPPQERFVIGLCFWQDMTEREVGEVLGVTESRVSRIRTGALDRLRIALAVHAE